MWMRVIGTKGLSKWLRWGQKVEVTRPVDPPWKVERDLRRPSYHWVSRVHWSRLRLKVGDSSGSLDVLVPRVLGVVSIVYGQLICFRGRMQSAKSLLQYPWYIAAIAWRILLRMSVEVSEHGSLAEMLVVALKESSMLTRVLFSAIGSSEASAYMWV